MVHKNLLNACKAKSLQDGRAVKFLNSLDLPVMIAPMNVSCTTYTPKTSRSRAALDVLTPGSPSSCQSTPTAPPTTPDTGSFSTPKRPRRFVRS